MDVVHSTDLTLVYTIHLFVRDNKRQDYFSVLDPDKRLIVICSPCSGSRHAQKETSGDK